MAAATPATTRRVVAILCASAGLAILLSIGGRPALASGQMAPTPTQSSSAGADDPVIGLALPDLTTLPPHDLRLVQNATRSYRIVRFSNSIANVGVGPLEISGAWRSAAEGYEVRQQLFTGAGEIALEPLLSAIDYHPAHGHWHLAAFARYELWSTVDGSLFDVVRTSGKVSYCLMDTDRQPDSPDAPRGYAYCGPARQGISPGWADTYQAHIPGQWIDVAGLPPGVYALRSVVNPYGELRESDYSNNVGIIYFRLTADQLVQMEGPAGSVVRPGDTGPIQP